jgi:ParB-like chromosome segregation protein Spo0J
MDNQKMPVEKPVALDQKDIGENPGPFCMSFGFDLRPLMRSIEEFGLINRPIVTMEGEGGVEVVAGYRRILALKSLKWKKVPCRDISDSGLSPLQRLLFNLYDNLATRQFNDVEKGMILKRLIPHIPREEILEDYMPLLGLPSHESTLHIFLGLQDLENHFKESLLKKRISIQAIKMLLGLDPDSRSAIHDWILMIKLNFNQQIQFIECTIDISLRERKAIAEILREKQISALLEDEKLNKPQKAKLVLDLLRSRRFPSLSRSEKAFQEKVSSLGFPEGVKVRHPPFFEGSDYRLEILFKDGKDLKGKTHSISQLSGLEKLGDPWQEDL